MLSLIIRFIIPAMIILMVSELARRSPRLGALLLTLPLISILQHWRLIRLRSEVRTEGLRYAVNNDPTDSIVPIQE